MNFSHKAANWEQILLERTHSHASYLIRYHFISIMTDIFIIADLFLAHSHTCCCLSKRNWRPLSLCGLTYSSSSQVAVRMCGFAIAVLFVVSRYYIRSWFFPQSPCFSPCVVSRPVRSMCFLFACICTGVKTSHFQLQGVGVNSFCNTGCPLRPIVGGCLHWAECAFTHTDGFVLSIYWRMSQETKKGK